MMKDVDIDTRYRTGQMDGGRGQPPGEHLRAKVQKSLFARLSRSAPRFLPPRRHPCALLSPAARLYIHYIMMFIPSVRREQSSRK